eukprot:763851_1
MPPASASILSPHANPYVPMTGHCEDESSFKAIYVNGKPELVLTGEHPEHEIIHNIADDAIDEVFPPTAADAAELEALDNFLTMMVNLSYLEESEEKARNEMSHIKKRWESRQGLKGRPHNVTNMATRTNHILFSTEEKNLVRYGQHLRKSSNSSMDSRKREPFMVKNNKSKANKNLHGYIKPIHQPRKAN